MKFTLLIPALFLTANLFAQGVLEFKEKEINLKNLKADDVPTEVTYTFKNTGNQPVIISRVGPTSSQFQISWDRAPITPGKSGSIKISFPSIQMPETFKYNITVFSNAANRSETLSLASNIVDNPAKPQLLYKFDIGGLKFKNGTISFDKIYTWQTLTDTLHFFNGMQAPATIGFIYQPAHIKSVAIPETVAPGKKGMIIISYNATQKNDYGYCYENVIFSVNKSQDYDKRLTITANIVEDFSKLSKKDLANAPVINVEKKEINFGDIKPGSKANCEFVVKNTGKSSLVIRKTKASCGCTAVTLGNNTIAPGESGTIQAIFDSTGKSGKQYKTITVISSDPATPEVMLTIVGNIVS